MQYGAERDDLARAKHNLWSLELEPIVGVESERRDLTLDQLGEIGAGPILRQQQMLNKA